MGICRELGYFWVTMDICSKLGYFGVTMDICSKHGHFRVGEWGRGMYWMARVGSVCVCWGGGGGQGSGSVRRSLLSVGCQICLSVTSLLSPKNRPDARFCQTKPLFVLLTYSHL